MIGQYQMAPKTIEEFLAWAKRYDEEKAALAQLEGMLKESGIAWKTSVFASTPSREPNLFYEMWTKTSAPPTFPGSPTEPISETSPGSSPDSSTTS